MIARANIVKGDPSKVDAGVAFVRDRVKPLVDSLPGSQGLGMWVNRETGEAVVTTVWEDQRALDASEARVSEVRAEAAAIAGAQSVRVESADTTAVWQAAGDEVGYWTRQVEMGAPADRLDEMINLFNQEILPQIQTFEGVNTVVLGVNRMTGMTILGVTYRTRADMDAARERADAMRGSVRERFGAGEPIVHELEVAIVGIRGPEIAGQREAAATEQRQPTTQA